MPSTVFVKDLFVDESQAFADFVVYLDAASATPLSVRYATSDASASRFSDYTTVSGTLNFAAGETSKTVRVALDADLVAEGVESFYLSLSTPTNALIGQAFARATVFDNDGAAGTPVVSISEPVVNESTGEAVFVISLDRPGAGNVSFNYATQNGTAVAGQDFTATAGSLSFAAGEMVRTVSVLLANDAAAEGNEAFSLVLSNLVGATARDPVGTATIWANDGLPLALPSVFVEDTFVDETQDFAEFTVYLSAPSVNLVSVGYATSDSTASRFSDYTTISGTLNFAPGETVKTVRVELDADLLAEDTEAFYLSLSGPANAVLGQAYARATVVDNDAAPAVPVVSISDPVVNESTREALFVLTLDRPSTGTVSLDYATQSGTALAGDDFTAVSGSLQFGAGEMVRTVVVPLANDVLAEGNEAFTLVLSNLVGATARDPVGNATVWANDAVPLAQPSIFVEDVTVDETQSFAEFTVYLSAPSVNAVGVSFATSDSTASRFSDYTTLTGTLNFAAGETVKTVRVELDADLLAENTEAFYLSLSSPTNALLGQAFARATVHDNDAPPGVPMVSISDPVVDEAGRQALFVVTLDRPSTGPVSFSYATQNGGAGAGQDFTTTEGSVTMGPGEMVRTIAVPLSNDVGAEPAETFALVLSNLAGATTFDPVGVATVRANDSPPLAQPSITIDDVVVDEGQGYAEFTISLNAPSANAVSVRYATADSTASRFSDYTSLSGTLNFAAGETVKTVRVEITDNLTTETAESLALNLSNPTNALIGRAQALATIYDDDGTPMPASSAGNDTYTVTDPSTHITETANAGTDQVRSNVSFALADFIENLELLGTANLNGQGNAAANVLLGNSGHNNLLGGQGNDSINGGAGFDAALFAGNRASYTISYDSNSQLFTVADNVAGRDGTDTLVNVELFRFADQSVTSASFIPAGATPIDGTAGPDNLTGTGVDDTVNGLAGNDLLNGLGGDDVLDGGAGIDTVVYAHARSQVTLARQGDGSVLAEKPNAQGIDRLIGIERVAFADGNLALDTSASGHAGQTALLLGAALGSAAAHNAGLVGIVLPLFDQGFTLGQLSDLLVSTGIMAQTGAGPGNASFATRILTNLGIPASGELVGTLAGLLDAQALTQGQLLSLAATLAFNEANVGLVGLAETGLAYT